MGESKGEIHVILRPMFAGKTTSLLKKVKKEQEAGRRVALVKPVKDTRFEFTNIVTHNGCKTPCYAVERLEDFKSSVGRPLYQELVVIAVNEAQVLAICSNLFST